MLKSYFAAIREREKPSFNLKRREGMKEEIGEEKEKEKRKKLKKN